MSGHRHYHRRRRSPESSSSGSWSESSSSGSWTSTGSSMRASSTETDDDVHGGGHRRLKRSSASLSLPMGRSQASHPSWSWVLLNRAGARRDDFRHDHTTSAMSHTSRGEEISVSFELAEPPGTSVLTFDWQPRPSSTPRKFLGNVIAAHRKVVLLAMMSYEVAYPSNIVIDLFVYQASYDHDRHPRRREPSLWRLPSTGGPVLRHHLLGNGEIGVMSCTGNDVAGSPSFVVAQLQMRLGEEDIDVRLFRPGFGQWESLENLHVHGGHDLCWWTTDAVVPYESRYMIWVDYYRGMILMDLSSRLDTMRNRYPPRPPRLRYVPLPVDTVGDPEHTDFGSRGYPLACRGVCATRYGIKFVSVDTQHWSNFGVGHRDVLKWSRRFRITTWSLREDEYTWRKDTTMHEEEFWDAFDGGDRYPFPHVQPRFPVVDMDNPDVVIFRLDEPGYPEDPKWMIKVDMRKKVLLAATVYSNKESDGLYSDEETINSARMRSDPIIPSELSQYLCGGQGQDCKKRKQ